MALSAGTLIAVAQPAPSPAIASPVDSVASATPSGGGSTDPDVVKARGEAQSSGSPVEVASLDDEYSTTYANADGTMTTDTSLTPLRVQQGDSWVAVDYDLEHVNGGWSPKVSPVPVVFSDGADSDAAAIGTGTKEVDLSWDVTLPTPTVDGPRATYDLGGGESLVLTAVATGFEQSLVLASPPSALPQIKLPLDTSDLTVRPNAGGGYDFVNSTGAAAYSMQAPIMYGSAVDPDTGEPAQSKVVSSSLVQTSAGPRLDLTPSLMWLQDPSTTYPVTIDPVVAHVGGGSDTYVQSGVSTAMGSSALLHAGEYNGTSPARAYLRFTGVSNYADVHILNSMLTLWNNVAGSCTPATVHAYRLTSDFITGGTTWSGTGVNAKPTFDTSSTYSGSSSFAHGDEADGCPNAFASIDVTKMVTAWAVGTIANQGMQLSGTETAGSQFWAFCSLNYDATRSDSCTSSAHAPALSITYNTDPDPVDRRSQLPGDAAEVGTLTPTLHAVFSDPDADQGHIVYTVYDGTTNLQLAAGAGSTVASGSDSPWTVPTAVLTNGNTYRWTAQAVDAITPPASGPVSGSKFFNTDAADKTGQQRRFSFETRHLTDRLDLNVNVANGNLLLHATDLHLHGTGIDLTVDRYYNSLSTATGEMSKGWTLGIGQDVKLLLAATNPTTSDVTYVAPSGFSARFDHDATGSNPGSGGTPWHHPPGVDADLSFDSTHNEWDLKFFPSEGRYVFNTSGQLIRQEDRNSNKILFGYNGSGQMTTATDQTGGHNRVINFGYTSSQLTSVTDWTNRTVTYGYNPAGYLSNVTDAAGKVLSYDYTGDLLTKITTPENSITQIDYASDGSRRVADDFGSYDPGNGVSTNATTSFDYNATSSDCPNAAGVTKETDPNGNNTTSDNTDGITTYCRDDRDRVTKVIDALGHHRSKSYNSNDNTQTLTDGLEQQTTLAWDPNDENMTSVSLPTGATTSFGYGNATHPHSVMNSTDSQGNQMTYTYDTPGNLNKSTSSSLGLLLTIDHNTSDGTVSKITDGDNNITTYGYTNGDLTSVDNPAPLGDITYSPDALSRVHTMTDGKGQTTTYTYDNIDRPDVTTFNDSTTVDQDYDGDGNLTKLTDNTGVTTFAYDKAERQIRKTVPSNEQLRYGYDHNGNLTSYTDSGGTIAYTYNQVNLVTGAAEPGGDCTTTPITNPCTTFQYDENNRRTQTSYPTSPNRTVMNIGYDHSGRETSINTTVGSTNLQNLTYNYQLAGQDTNLRQSMTDPGGSTTYVYDALNRLKTVTGGLSRSYSYDLAFNRTSKTVNGTSTNYAYNAANELTTTNNANTYNYDGNGNITSGGGGWSMSYNAKNQTTSATQPGGTALSPLVYSGTDQNERVQAGTTTYVNSALGVSSATVPAGSGAQTGGSGVTADAIIDGNPNQISTTYYTRDNRGNLVSMRDPSGSYYYLFDGLGSVVGLVNSAGSQVNTYSYDPYGEQLSASQTVANPWRYVGGQYDGATGLTKFGVRYYNAGEGRFTQRDPSGKDLPYSYASDSPVNMTDPTGQITAVEGALIGGGVIAGIGLATFGIGAAVGGVLDFLSFAGLAPEGAAGAFAGLIPIGGIVAGAGAVLGGIASGIASLF